MSHPTSPVLHNSSFSQFDYFATGGRPPIFTLSLTTSPAPSSSSSPRLLSTPERSRSSSPCPVTSDRPSDELQLGSPRVLTSPRLGVKRDSGAARKSVQFGEKSAVNWARPLRVDREQEQEPELDPISSMRIFGASLQRSRRLNRSPVPSPSSSDDEPLTPSPVTPSADDSVQVSARGWSVFTSAKGLGVSGVAEWDPPVTPLRELSLEALPDFAFEPLDLSPVTSSTTPPKRPTGLPRSFSKPILHQTQSQNTPSNPRILATSQSLNSFSSPSNLDELRTLKQAAVLLETEARKPIRPLNGSKDTQRERKIKRKAVPSIIESDLLESSPASSIAPSSSASSPDSDFGPAHPRRSSLIEVMTVPRQLPGMGNAIFSRHRQLYQNHSASRSVIEVSPRAKSLSVVPIVVPPRVSSPPATSSPSRFRGGLNEGSSNASSASSLHDQPLTPNSLSASQTEYFLSSVETAFKKLESERAEINQKGFSSVTGKHKRGFSRFLGKKSMTTE
ncbi:hypothetical protein I317_02121 [Kwoniella heveanensis CBS 569]|uniref:Uncharacterized protein n=1 Tax=Kwoniella heveanensis BCC8398 TaxID=1296120 RepID=A0A1B9GP24_9TREE|nr:hypothetical protein I316_05678 [Kwoniella heveanensis BCC8398]OCF44014.1 hypothetical protein I317_02121 [Kwoniella heveanensis CBS 569]